jgi:hypothetical protein
MRAVALGKLEIIQALLEAGADPWVGEGDAGRCTAAMQFKTRCMLTVAGVLTTAHVLACSRQ